MRTNTFIRPAGLTLLLLGASHTACPAWEQSAVPSTVEHGHLIRVQERMAPRSTFRGRPEFPPPDYLAEFDEMGRQQHESGEQNMGRLPGPPGAPATGRAMERPEYAPGGRSGQYPGARPEFPGSSRPGGTPSPFPETAREPPGRRTWGQPPAPPSRGAMEPGGISDRPGAAWPERDEFPPRRPRWQAPPSSGATGYEHQWPTSPSSGSGYQTQPEFHSGSSPERSRPGGTPDRFANPPEFPGPRPDWQR